MVETISERGEDIGTTIASLSSRAAAGDHHSQYLLGTIYFVALTNEPEQDLDLLGNPTLEMAFALLLPPAKRGDLHAQFTVGGMFHEGLGVEQDYDRAMYWLRKSADQGFSNAYFLVGEMFADGEGAPQDKVEAARWYFRSANAGFTRGQYRLGTMHMIGEGAARDLVLAHRWLRLSVAGGYDRARLALRDLNEIISPEQIAEAERDGEAWLNERGEETKQKFTDFHDLEKLLNVPKASD